MFDDSDPPNDDKDKLWQEFCQSTTPIKNKGKYVVKEAISSKKFFDLSLKTTVKGRYLETTSFILDDLKERYNKDHKELVTNRSHRVDRSTSNNLISGKYIAEATLDLHNMTQDQAYDALVEFIEKSYQQKKRCVLVITGKGGSVEGRGVLYRQTPKWLNSPRLKPAILMFSHADRKRGGEGALYVLIRRNR